MRVRAGLFAIIVAAAAGAAPDSRDDLKRRGYLGAQLGPVNAEVKKGQKLDTDDGAEVREVMPGSAAEASGVRAGDVLVAINGATVKSPGEAVATVSRGKAGDEMALDLVREARKTHLKVTLKARPRESAEGFETVYGSLTSKAGRQRTILTRPRSPGRHPALLLIPGLGCYSVEGSPGRPTEFQRIAGAFTAGGYVTLRVEKPGCGDSEGGPCEDVDFLTELDGYRQGLKLLKERDDVDPASVVLFGHSLGGLWAPILASEQSVKGVAVYGTVLKPWYEYELENRRRQLVLAGGPFPEIDREMREFAAFLFRIYAEKQTPGEAVSQDPSLKDTRESFSPDGVHMYGRSVKFMQQVAALPTSEYWSKVDAHVLAAWGKAEYISTESDHRMLAEMVNQAHPGKGSFVAIEGMDHGFHRAASAAERFKQVSAGVPSEFNPAIIEVLLGWADKVVGGPKAASPVTP